MSVGLSYLLDSSEKFVREKIWGNKSMVSVGAYCWKNGKQSRKENAGSLRDIYY